MIDYSILNSFSRTRSRGRTGTSFRTLVFETNASTDSAIRACVAEGGSPTVEVRKGMTNYEKKQLILYICPVKAESRSETGAAQPEADGFGRRTEL